MEKQLKSCIEQYNYVVSGKLNENRSQDAYYMRGCLFYERGLMDKAIDDFQHGVCFQALGRHQEAYDMY